MTTAARASLEQHGLLPGTIKSLLTNATRGFTTLYEQVWDSTGPELDLPVLSEDDLTALDEMKRSATRCRRGSLTRAPHANVR